jgi:DNA-directed RNA polymerase subunit RPC12/RpoP
MEHDTVRRCRRCGEPTVIVINRWEGRRLFRLLPTGRAARTDHRCQTCGAAFSLQPYLLLRFAVGSFVGVQLTLTGVIGSVGACVALFTQGPVVALLLAVLAAGTLGLGLLVARFVAGPQVQAWLNPLVPGAVMPELHLGPPEDRRTCSCGHPARCMRVTAHTTNGLPTGTDRTYACDACGTQFEVPDGWAVVFRTGATAFLGTILVVLASLTPLRELTGSDITCLAVLGLGTLGGCFLATLGLVQLLRHPRTTAVLPT